MERRIAYCALVLIGALMVVGVVSDGVGRHLLQTAPAWLVVGLGLRGSGLTRWAAAPIFTIWLAIMVLIWLFLLHIANILHGHFSPTEIAMTIVVALSAVCAFVFSFRGAARASVAGALAAFTLAAALQCAALWLSVQWPFYSDAALRAWAGWR
jgi:hypothetical protein